MNTMIKQQQLVQLYLKQANASLAKKPLGNLIICKHRGQDQYYRRTSPSERKGVYLSKKGEMNLIKALAQKDYDKKFILAAKKLAHNNDRLIKWNAEREIHFFYLDLAQVYLNLSPARQKLVTPYVPPDDMFIKAWKAQEYQGNLFSFNPDQEIFTLNKERVRSKSEKIIADKLWTDGIPYRYEYPLITNALGRIYPDFTLLDIWNRVEVIFEHFGMLHDESYCKKMLIKLRTYMQEGYFSENRFIFTTESANHSLSTTQLDDLLRNRFPYMYTQTRQ